MLNNSDIPTISKRKTSKFHLLQCLRIKILTNETGKNRIIKKGNQMLRIKYLDCFRFFCTTILESFIIVKHVGFRNDTAFRRFTAVR